MARSYSILSLIISCMVVNATFYAYEETFLRANQFYRDRDYQSAFDTYNALDDKGPAVWYNMGHCALMMEQFDQARLFFERAKRGASVTLYHAIRHALQELDTRLEQDAMSLSTGSMYTVYFYSTFVPLALLQLLILVGWYVWILLWWRVTHRRRAGLLLTLFIGIMSLSLLLAVRYYYQRKLLAIVVKPEVTLYAGPNERYHALGSLYQADCVEIVQKDASWYNVKNRHAHGWIPKECIACV